MALERLKKLLAVCLMSAAPAVPAGEIRFYLKKIAFPAINIYTAYNADTGKLRTSAGAGFSF